MQFIADNMLGKLAKWLRFMGYDTIYPKKPTDDELIQLSQSQDRYLLTRDKELARRKNLKVIYIQSDQLEAQLKQIKSELHLELSADAFLRCPECNHLIKQIDKLDVKNKVPKGVFDRQDQFWVCTNCNRYYWQGSHYEKIKDKLNSLVK